LSPVGAASPTPGSIPSVDKWAKRGTARWLREWTNRYRKARQPVPVLVLETIRKALWSHQANWRSHLLLEESEMLQSCRIRARGRSLSTRRSKIGRAHV